MTSELRGVMPAMATPFTEDGSAVDEGALRELVDGFVAAAVHGLAPCGSSGEFPALTDEERRRVVEVTVEQAAGRVPVVAHTGTTTTRGAVELTKHAEAAGADAILAVHPYYQANTPDELVDYFRDVGHATDLPLMAYNFPAATGVTLDPALLARLADEVPTLRYVKSTADDLSQLEVLLLQHADAITVFNGWDSLSYPALALGGKGLILGSLNLMPAQYAELFDLAQERRLEEARALWERMWPVAHFVLSSGFGASIKAGLALRGFTVGPPRLPVRPLAPDKVDELRGLMATAGALDAVAA